MTSTDFRAALARLDYSQRAFAAYVDINERTVRRWASGAQEVPQWAAVLIGLMEQVKQA